MFLNDLQMLIQNILIGAVFQIKGSSLFFEHEDIVGHAKITQFPNYVFLDQLYLKTNKQGKGIGTNILNAVMTACRNNGIARIECLPTQGGALSGLPFCKKNNFTQIGETARWERCV